MGTRRRQGMAATVLAAAILVAVVAAAYWWRQGAPMPPERPVPVDRKPAAPLLASPLTAEMRVVERTRYPRCDVVLETERPPTPLETGRRLADLLRSRETWRLVERAGDRVVLEREVGGQCPPAEWLRYRTVRIHHGRVAVFYGREPGAPLRLLTDIETGRLLPGDRRRLDVGLVVASDREAWQVIESLTP